MPKENGYLVFQSDMNTGAVMRIFKQDDGDIIVAIDDPEGGINGGSVEFCAPFTGGGQHERLWKCLSDFFRKEIEIAAEYDRSTRNRLRAD